VIKNKRGKILLLRRNKAGGWFTLPGGTVHEGEAVNQALKREIFEETGLRIKIGRPLWIWQSDHIGQKLVGIVFETKEIFPNNIKIKLSPEHNKYSWYSTEKLFRDEAVDPYIKREALNLLSGYSTAFWMKLQG